MERERGFTFDSKDKLKALVARGCLETYAELFGQSFVNALDSAETDDKHHSEALFWHWNARMALINFELELKQLEHLVETGAMDGAAFLDAKDDLQNKWYPEFWAYLAYGRAAI